MSQKITEQMAKASARAEATRRERAANRRPAQSPPVERKLEPMAPTVSAVLQINGHLRGVGIAPTTEPSEMTPRQQLATLHRRRADLMRSIVRHERVFINDPSDARNRERLAAIRLTLSELESDIGTVHTVVVGLEAMS